MMITDIKDFFTRGCGRCARFDTPDCSVKQWTAGLNELRRICRSLELEETVKWAHPCYMHAGRNIAIIGALRGDFRLTFFYASLMKDPDGVLERQGPNTRHPDMIRFTGNDQVVAMEGIIRSYLEEALDYARQGLKPAKEEGELDLPDELVEALDADPELAEAFHALTPGRQRSYVIALGSAKTSQTRIGRIAKHRDRIIAGKGATER
jgi:uncharacterized protein YdeI (YjbR/CyaY-like superfamily)